MRPDKTLIHLWYLIVTDCYISENSNSNSINNQESKKNGHSSSQGLRKRKKTFLSSFLGNKDKQIREHQQQKRRNVPAYFIFCHFSWCLPAGAENFLPCFSHLVYVHSACCFLSFFFFPADDFPLLLPVLSNYLSAADVFYLLPLVFLFPFFSLCCRFPRHCSCLFCCFSSPSTFYYHPFSSSFCILFTSFF